MFKEEPEDLTHLAPTAGDSCIPLEVPNVIFPAEFLQLDLTDLTPDVLDCFPLTGFEFPSLVLPAMELSNADVAESSPMAVSVTEEVVDATRPASSLLSTTGSVDSFKEDPFLFFDAQNGGSRSECIADSSLPPPSKVTKFIVSYLINWINLNCVLNVGRSQERARSTGKSSVVPNWYQRRDGLICCPHDGRWRGAEPSSALYPDERRWRLANLWSDRTFRRARPWQLVFTAAPVSGAFYDYSFSELCVLNWRP